MIKIQITEKEREVLEIVYVNHFVKKGGGVVSYDTISDVVNLASKTVEELRKIKGKLFPDRLTDKYDMIVKTAKKEGKYSNKYFKNFGFPLSKEGKLNVSLVKKMLILNIEKLEEMPCKDVEILEIQFFYSLLDFKRIIEMKSSSNLKLKLEYYGHWYEYAIPIIKEYFNVKKTVKSTNVLFEKIVCEEDIQDDLLNKSFSFAEKIYSIYENELKDIHDYLNKLVDYEHYLKDLKLKYLLSYMNGTDVCPYCNRQYISFIDGRSTFTLDHYKREQPFPILKLSLYNLVPSCYICNSLLKHRSDLVHLNPWYHGDEGITFSYDSSKCVDLRDYYEKKNCDNIQNISVVIDTTRCTKRAKNSIDVFHLDEVYKSHSKYASQLVAKAMKYECGNYKMAVFDVLKNNNIMTDISQLDIFLYGTIFNDTEIDRMSMKQPLYKMSADIVLSIRKEASSTTTKKNI